MNDGNDWQDHQTLMESGFADFTVQKIVSSGDCVGTIPVISGDNVCVELLAAEDFSYALAPGESSEIVLAQPGFVYAPVVQGQEAGYAYACLNRKVVGKISLVYGQTVEMEKEEERSLWERLFERR